MNHGKGTKLFFCPQTTEVYYRIKTEFGDFFPKSAIAMSNHFDIIFIVMSNHFAALNS